MDGVTDASLFIRRTGMALLPLAFIGWPSVVAKPVLSALRLKV